MRCEGGCCAAKCFVCLFSFVLQLIPKSTTKDTVCTKFKYLDNDSWNAPSLSFNYYSLLQRGYSKFDSLSSLL